MKIKIKLKESFALIIVTCFLSEAQSVTFCGQRNAVIGTIFGGEEVSRNAWPWLVAFHNRLKKKFFCAGSLITEKHVLSGKYCRTFSDQSDSILPTPFQRHTAFKTKVKSEKRHPNMS